MKSFQKIKDTKQDLKKSVQEILLVEDVKAGKFAGFKVSPSKPTDEQVAKINQFTRRTFTADELYVGQMRLAHNAIDRDNERFHEEVVQRFVNTAIRKTMLLDHDRSLRDSAAGKYFDVELEKMPLQQAVAETGQNLKLPDGVTEVWFVSPWFFIPLEGIDPKEIVKIDAGIYDWASIGFRAEKLVPILDKEGRPLFWEYRGAGEDTEMTEGSLVYLGAQPGAAVKSHGADEEEGAKAATLNRPAVQNANSLIAAGKVDKDSAWSISPAEENAILGDPPDWQKYSRWHLGTDPDAAAETKLHYKYPIGKGGKLYRSALTAIRQRAAAQGATDIYDAAGRLIEKIDNQEAQFDNEPPDTAANSHTEGGNTMTIQELLERLKIFFGRPFTEANVFDEIKAAVEEKTNLAVEGAKKPLNEEIKKLQPLAEDGKTYRNSLVAEFVSLKAKLGEVSEKPENQTALKEMALTYPIDFLKVEIAQLKARVADKWPAEAQLLGSLEDRSSGGAKVNPFIPKEA